ncbi:hypothetical protein PSHT_01563 [Puccinia striiformis]|uniref:Uncharacterized protein n=1 Tax=Puccinia striiformis TaxID=27350 RepID=A0A2S4WKC4_9BASI|nr:hypothetical protein PSHT_01563 [Puccinia striiformis]
MALTVAQSTQRKRRHGKTGDSAPQPAKPLKKVKAPLQLVIPTDDEETDNDGIPLLGVPETNNFDNEIKIMEFQEHKIAEQDIANDIIQLLQASLDIGTSDEDKLSGSDSKIKRNLLNHCGRCSQWLILRSQPQLLCTSSTLEGSVMDRELEPA